MWRYDITEMFEKLKEKRAMYWWRKAENALVKSRDASNAGDSELSGKWYRRYLKYWRKYGLWCR